MITVSRIYRRSVGAFSNNWRLALAAGAWSTVLLAACGASAVALTTLSAFPRLNGIQPEATLLLGTNGGLYGTASAGGRHGRGTVFTATLAGALTNLASFDGTNGAQPFAKLIQGTDGNFYGTTAEGGAHGLGTVFTMTPVGGLSALVSFDGTNGAHPFAGLVQGTNGNFYGTTSGGGVRGLGTIFTLTPAGTLSTLAFFDGTNGARPYGALVQDASGNLYGTTSAGGMFNAGAVFAFKPADNTLTNLHSFTGLSDGAGPQSGLVLGRDGKLYGTTAGGGMNAASGGDGVVFQITPSGVFTNLFSFSGTNGANPFAALVQASDGNLYGSTSAGGAQGAGTLFCITIAGKLTTLHSFSGGSDGASPHYAGLVQATDGNFYGVTSTGGQTGYGTLFQLSGFVPSIVAPPVRQTVPAGTTVTLAVTAAGSSPLSYQWQMNSNNLVNHANISGVTTPVLTISNAAAANSGTYSVIVRNAAGAITNSDAVLTVIDPYGTNRPIIAITSPRPGVKLNQSMITVTGTVSDRVPVARVYFQLNGADWQLATSTLGSSRWTANVVLPPGTNVVQAYAVNIVGTLSQTNSVTFLCGITSAPVVVQINGLGTVSPNYDGQSLQVGLSYKMTAKPGAGYLFSNWSQSVFPNAPVVTNTPLLNFTAQSNLVIQATFVPNPFIPASGTYSGLFYDTNDVALDSSGFFTLALTSRGTFSGSLQMGATRFPMSGLFGLNGLAQLTVARRNLAPLSVALQLDLAQGTDRITGMVSSSPWTAELAGDRAVFDGRSSVAPQVGRFTLIIPGSSSSTTEPGGDSYGTITVDKAGKILLAGALADGTKISQAVPLSKDGLWPLYVPLYNGQGVLLSWVSLRDAPAEELSGLVTWIKPPMAAAKYYPAGFTVQTNASGSRYRPSAGSTNVLSLTNAALVLSGGNLAQSITNVIVLGPHNRVTNVSGPKITVTFTSSTGLFRGSVIDPATMKPISFNGVVLQSQDVGRGYFLGPNQSGAVFLGP
jgi:uncharacterized repeat protein (TIGR03803 family)